MRGINISSIIFLLIVLFNFVVIIMLYLKKKKSVKYKRSGIGILCTLVINIVLIFCLFYFSVNICTTRYNIVSSILPNEFDGYKILQISDFHTDSFSGGTEKLIKKAKTENPDIVVLTGDLVDETSLHINSVSELVSQLVLIAPVYSVSGNHDVYYHDFYGLEMMLDSHGVILLDNKKAILQRGNAHINIAGISDPDIFEKIDSIEYVISSMHNLKPEEGFNILLFHRANMFDILKGKGYQLILSGHMHGGQVQIPFVGGIISPQKDRVLFPKFTEGKWTEFGTTMIVSRGLGNNVPVPRILNPPEIVVITLKKA